MSCIKVIESVYETLNIYVSVILCSRSSASRLFDDMIKNDYPVYLYNEKGSVDDILNGNCRSVIVTENDYESFMEEHWNPIAPMVTLVFYDSAFDKKKEQLRQRDMIYLYDL